MAYVITERCMNPTAGSRGKDTSCVGFCPVDAIHPRKDQKEFETSGMLYISPSVCIDCGFCERACRTRRRGSGAVKAIFAEKKVPEEYRRNVQVNAEYYRLSAGEFLVKWGQTVKDGQLQA